MKIKMKLPNKISPCPIVNCTIEIIFERREEVPNDAVFGMIFNAIGNDFKTHEEHPLKKFFDLRDDLKYEPHYKLINDNFEFQIGSNVLALVNPINNQNYVGWDDLSKKFYSLIEKIEKLGLINNYLKIGVRYINFFDFFAVFDIIDGLFFQNNIFSTLNNTIVRTTIEDDNYVNILSISNKAEIGIENEIRKEGSIIDIDSFYENDDGSINDFKTLKKHLEKVHNNEKQLFFNLLNNEYLEKTYDVEY